MTFSCSVGLTPEFQRRGRQCLRRQKPLHFTFPIESHLMDNTSDHNGATHETPEKLIQAVKLHTAGKLVEAGCLYHELLREDPMQPDAWHLVGVLSHQAGSTSDAIGYVLRAISISPDVADFHNNLAVMYSSQNEPTKALACVHRALQIDPLHRGAKENFDLLMFELDDATDDEDYSSDSESFSDDHDFEYAESSDHMEV